MEPYNILEIVIQKNTSVRTDPQRFSYLFTYITGKITHFVSSYYLFFLLIFIAYDYIGKTGDL